MISNSTGWQGTDMLLQFKISRFLYSLQKTRSVCNSANCTGRLPQTPDLLLARCASYHFTKQVTSLAGRYTRCLLSVTRLHSLLPNQCSLSALLGFWPLSSFYTTSRVQTVRTLTVSSTLSIVFLFFVFFGGGSQQPLSWMTTIHTCPNNTALSWPQFHTCTDITTLWWSYFGCCL